MGSEGIYREKGIEMSYNKNISLMIGGLVSGLVGIFTGNSCLSSGGLALIFIGLFFSIIDSHYSKRRKDLDENRHEEL
jgi:hypothetical protein